uniref:Uncharacterized protein n=1 Tax=Lepeophtheirus salmonis TaxID=72036 RepID=A0A0K2SZE8_LEPSM
MQEFRWISSFQGLCTVQHPNQGQRGSIEYRSKTLDFVDKTCKEELRNSMLIRSGMRVPMQSCSESSFKTTIVCVYLKQYIHPQKQRKCNKSLKDGLNMV